MIRRHETTLNGTTAWATVWYDVSSSLVSCDIWLEESPQRDERACSVSTSDGYLSVDVDWVQDPAVGAVLSLVAAEAVDISQTGQLPEGTAGEKP